MLHPKALGQTGLIASEVGLNLNFSAFSPLETTSEETFRQMDAMINLGASFVNVASDPVFDKLRHLGNYLKKSDAKNDVTIAISLDFSGDFSRRSIVRGVDNHLKALQREHIDILYVEGVPDPAQLEGILRLTDNLVKSGKILHIGCSNLPTWLLAYSLWLSESCKLTRFDLAKSVYDTIVQDVSVEFLPFAQTEKVSFIADLSGILSRSKTNLATSSRYHVEKSQSLIEQTVKIADKYEVSFAALLINWAVSKGANCCLIPSNTLLSQQYKDEVSSNAIEELNNIATKVLDTSPLNYPFSKGTLINDDMAARTIDQNWLARHK